MAFNHIDRAFGQRKTQLNINRGQCVAGFEDEDVDQFGEVFGVGGEFFNASGYEFPQGWVGVVLGCVVDGCVGTQCVHESPFGRGWENKKPAEDFSRAGVQLN